MNNDSKIIKKIFLSLFPVQALSLGLPTINSLIDSIIIGNTQGTKGLAAVGFVTPLTWVVITLGLLFSTGSQILCGRCLGKGDTEGIQKIFNTALFWGTLSGLALTVISVLFPEQIATLLGASEDCFRFAVDYIRGYSIGIVFIITGMSLLPFLQFDNAGTASTVASVSMLIVNLALNLINYYVFRWGMFGIGLATSAGNFVSVLISVLYLALKNRLFVFSLRYVRFKTLLEISHLGLPTAISPGCLVLRDRVMNACVFELAGTVGMSAMTIAGNFNSAIGCLVESGYSGSGKMISSILVGQRDRESLQKLPEIMITSGWYFYVAAYLLVLIFTKPLALLFGADPGYMSTYVLVIRLFNLWYITNIIKAPPLCVYQGLGRVNFTSLITVLNIAVVPVAVCVFLKNVFGLAIIAAIPPLGEIVVIIVYIICYAIHSKSLPKSFFDLAYIPDSVGVPARYCFNGTITGLEEAVAASRNVMRFCRQNNIGQRESYFCSLCIEEMATDAVLNRFSEKENNAIDYRIIYENGRLSIMLRDNCLLFDPCKWLELYADEDPGRSIGIKIVSGISREMTYTNVMGLNVLNITVDVSS